MSVVGAQCIIPLASPALPPFLIKCHQSRVLTELLVRRESAIGQENKNKKPKEKPKQNTSPSANVSQSLNSHHTPSSATKTLPIDFFHNKTSLRRRESNTVCKNVNAAQARGRLHPLRSSSRPIRAATGRPDRASTRRQSTELALNTRYLPITSLQVGTYVSTNSYVTGRNWGGGVGPHVGTLHYPTVARPAHVVLSASLQSLWNYPNGWPIITCLPAVRTMKIKKPKRREKNTGGYHHIVICVVVGQR